YGADALLPSLLFLFLEGADPALRGRDTVRAAQARRSADRRRMEAALADRAHAGARRGGERAHPARSGHHHRISRHPLSGTAAAAPPRPGSAARSATAGPLLRQLPSRIAAEDRG